MPRPLPGDHSSFYQKYIDKVSGDDAHDVVENSLAPLEVFLRSVPEDKATYAYGAGKWTVKQLLQHVIDAERVFAYRAMCIARGEQQPLPGFDEKPYADNADASNRNLKDLVEEMLLMRKTTIEMCKGFTADALQRRGTASNYSVTVNALVFMIVGHTLHHQQILTERYLVEEDYS